MGAQAFEQRYGSNGNLRNAFGKCVSLHASGKATGGGSTSQTQHFTVTLAQLNSSNVSGSGSLLLNDSKLQVKLSLTGLEAGQSHEIAIRGLASGSATCPTAAADTNHDGTISFNEGLPFYSQVLVPLQPFPTANASGNVHYEETLTASASTIGALETRTIVLHGKTVGGTYDATLPVACGTIASTK
jgi:hypothetical protein